LQAKLRDFETRSVHASIEVQKAARAVAWENTQLRGLLFSSGFSKDGIEDFLRKRRDEQQRFQDGTLQAVLQYVVLNCYAVDASQS
jgi:hypothetical protein